MCPICFYLFKSSARFLNFLIINEFLNFLIINEFPLRILAAKVDITVRELNDSRSNFAICEAVKI